MRRRSLVTRSRLSDDRRRYAIELTESGRELLDEIFISVTAMEDDILGILTPSDLLFLGYILDKLYVSLDPEAEV